MEEREISFIGDSIDEVLTSYKTFLELKYPSHFQEFLKREKGQVDSTRLEAGIFAILRHRYHLNPKIAEIIGSGGGGVDFLCEPQDGSNFVLEATHLDSGSVEQQSGLPNIPVPGKAGGFSMITDVLRKKATTKANQLANYPMPRVLCIGSTHSASTILLGKHAARDLMTSDPKISVPINQPVAETRIVTDLKESVFFRFDTMGNVEACRKSISAILLVTLDQESCLIVGLIHPEPAYLFDIRLFPDIPFLRLKEWPCKNGKVDTEWVTYNPSEKRVYLHKVELTTEELKRMDLK